MSSRKPGYLFGVFVLAALCCWPHGLMVYWIIAQGQYFRFMPDYVLRELGRVQRQEDLISDTWQDRLITYSHYAPANGATPFELQLIDPRTGEITSLKGEVPGTWGPQALIYGSRLWMIGTKTSLELVDGAFRPSSLVHPNRYPYHQQRFLWDGEPAFFGTGTLGFPIFTFDGKAWAYSHHLMLPDTVVIDGITVDFKKASYAACLNQGDRLHLFLEVEGRMLHHEGLRARAMAGPTTVTGNLIQSPVSALYPANMSGDENGWSIVNKTPMATKVIYPLAYNDTLYHLGMFVDGKLAAIAFDTSDIHAVVGHLYRFEEGKWTEFATQTFPFGTAAIREAISQDQQTTFLLVWTSAGLLSLYEVNGTGVHLLPRSQTVHFGQFVATQYLIQWTAMLVSALWLAAVNGLGVTLFMWWYTRPDYGFGLQQVKLAGIGRRALARLIDLGFLVVSSLMLAQWLTRGFDWLTLIEALNLQASHPILRSAFRILSALVLWLVACAGLMVVTQALWGVTPGKWCCGLRVLQTTLRPCGLAGSIARELVLYVDACGFLCWTPGITSIALTDQRQRLGDLIGGTIVVRAASMRD